MKERKKANIDDTKESHKHSVVPAMGTVKRKKLEKIMNSQ